MGLDEVTSLGFSDVREALLKAEDLAGSALADAETKLLDAQRAADLANETAREERLRANSEEDAKLLLETKCQKFEDKLESKRQEIKKLTAGIQDLVDKYEAKLAAKRKDNYDLHATVAHLQATIDELEHRNGGGLQKQKRAASESSGRKAKQKESPRKSPSRSPSIVEEKPGTIPERSCSREDAGKDREASSPEPPHAGDGDKRQAAVAERRPESSSPAKNVRARSMSPLPRRRERPPSSESQRGGSNGRSKPAAGGGGEEQRAASSQSRQGGRDAAPARRSASGTRSRSRRASRSRSGSAKPLPRRGTISRSPRRRSRSGSSGSGRGRGGRGERNTSSRPRSRSYGRNRSGGKGKGKHRDGQSLCLPYVSGVCRRGDSCRDHHPPEDNRKQLRDALGRKPCRFGGDCRRGDCIFSHPDSWNKSSTGYNKRDRSWSPRK